MNKPQSWKDSEGNVWLTSFKAVDAVRLREAAGIDLLDPKTMEAIFGSDLTETLKRVEVLAELARRQWEAKGWTYEQFADSLLSTETSFTEATAGLRASISYFFRQLGRADLATVCDRAWEMMIAQLKAMEEKAGGEKVTRILERAAAKGMEEVERELDRALEDLG